MKIYIFELKNDSHKNQSRYCREKLKEFCIKDFGYEFSDEDIAVAENGKPYFKNRQNLHFNISHSKDMAAIVIDHMPVGIDIEKIRHADFRIAKRFFTENEYKWISDAHNTEEREKRFFTIWTGKEAYTKMLGTGLRTPINTFDVLEEKIKSKLLYKDIERYILCVCSESDAT